MAAVRGGLHGVRQRDPRAARDRLHGARSAARGPGRAGHPLRLGVLRAAAHPARRWATPSPCPPARNSSPTAAEYLDYALGLPETRCWRWSWRRSGTPACCARCWPAAAGGTSRSSCSPRAGRPAAGPWWPRIPARWPPTTAAGRRWPAPTACTGSATWPSWPTPWSCSRPAAGARRSPAGSRPVRRHRHRHRARLRAGTRARGGSRRRARRAVRGHRPADQGPAGRAARPRPGAGQPAGRVGHRGRTRGQLFRVAGRAGRRSGGGRGRAGRGPGPRARRGPVLPGRGAGRRAAHRQAAGGARATCPAPSTRTLAAELRQPGLPVLEGTAHRAARPAPSAAPWPAAPPAPGPAHRPGAAGPLERGDRGGPGARGRAGQPAPSTTASRWPAPARPRPRLVPWPPRRPSATRWC